MHVPLIELFVSLLSEDLISHPGSLVCNIYLVILGQVIMDIFFVFFQPGFLGLSWIYRRQMAETNGLLVFGF